MEVSAQERGNGSPKFLYDGKKCVVGSSNKEGAWWYLGRVKTSWAAVVFDEDRLVSAVQFQVSAGTKFMPGGHEPIDYQVRLETEKHAVAARISVNGGQNPKRSLSRDGKIRTVTLELKRPVRKRRVVFECTKTKGMAPVLFEFELLRRP